MTSIEIAINSIKEKSNLLNAYANVLENLKSQELWYMHEDAETGELVDDDGEYAESNLKAIRNVIAAVNKLAGV